MVFDSRFWSWWWPWFWVVGGPRGSRTRGAASGRLATGADHRRAGGALDDVAILGASHPNRTVDHALCPLGTCGMTRRCRTSERARAVRAAIALAIRACAAAGRILRATDVTRRRLAGESTMTAALASAGAVAAFAVARGIVALAPHVTRRRAARQITAFSRGTGAYAVLTITADAAALYCDKQGTNDADHHSHEQAGPDKHRANVARATNRGHHAGKVRARRPWLVGKMPVARLVVQR